MSVNLFANLNYAGYTPNFMDLNHNKSFEDGINFLQFDFGLQQNLTSIGLVTGMGLTLNDYRFPNDNTIQNYDNVVRSVDLDPNGLLKSSQKIMTTSTLILSVMGQRPVSVTRASTCLGPIIFRTFSEVAVVRR